MFTVFLFYFVIFWAAFLLCIPIGPVNLEIFHTALKKHYAQALSIAFGAAVGDGIWAMVAYYGVSPFMSKIYLQGSFLLATAVITFILGYLALKNAKFIEKKEEHLIEKIKKKKRWALLKGLSLVIINPLGIVSFMVILQFLYKFNIRIEAKFNYEIFYFLIVCAGAFTYFSLVVFITNKMKGFFNPQRTAKVTRVLGYLLVVFSLYFFFNAIQSLFFKIDHFKA